MKGKLGSKQVFLFAFGVCETYVAELVVVLAIQTRVRARVDG